MAMSTCRVVANLKRSVLDTPPTVMSALRPEVSACGSREGLEEVWTMVLRRSLGDCFFMEN